MVYLVDKKNWGGKIVFKQELKDGKFVVKLRVLCEWLYCILSIQSFTKSGEDTSQALPLHESNQWFNDFDQTYD